MRNKKYQDTNVGKRLKEAMDRTGMTQNELSELSGVSQPAISQILHGRRKGVSLEIVLRLESALGTWLVPVVSEKIGLESFLRSPWAVGITNEEREQLSSTRWIPKGRKATERDWAVFLHLVRGLQREG